MVNSASMQVNRRSRRAKTDRIDLGKLLRALIAWCGGERHVWSVVRIPSVDEEDLRRSHRERSRLITERTAHINRIKGLLFAQGIRGINVKARYRTLRVDKLVTGEGRPLPPRLAQEITREIDRLGLVQQQIAAIEQERDESPTTCKETEKKRAQLLLLKGIGPTGSAVMAREVYYRQFSNRRQVAGFLGLATSPYDSGQMERSPGDLARGQRSCAGDHDPDGLALDQTSTQERACPMVCATDRRAESAHQAHHDRCSGAQARHCPLALSRAWSGSARSDPYAITLTVR